MKITTILGIMLVFFGCTNNKIPVGIWKGTYYCAQGETGLTLELRSYSNSLSNEFYGTFEFYPNTPSSDALYGKYSVKGKIIDDKIVIYPNEWIIVATGYYMVGMTGYLTDGNSRFKGKIDSSGCGQFNLTKH